MTLPSILQKIVNDFKNAVNNNCKTLSLKSYLTKIIRVIKYKRPKRLKKLRFVQKIFLIKEFDYI